MGASWFEGPRQAGPEGFLSNYSDLSARAGAPFHTEASWFEGPGRAEQEGSLSKFADARTRAIPRALCQLLLTPLIARSRGLSVKFC